MEYARMIIWNVRLMPSKGKIPLMVPVTECDINLFACGQFVGNENAKPKNSRRFATAETTITDASGKSYSNRYYSTHRNSICVCT